MREKRANTDGRTSHFNLELRESVRLQIERTAAARGETVPTFCLEAIRERLERLTGPRDTAFLTEMTAAADPVLAELWDNERDAAYDRLPAG